MGVLPQKPLTSVPSISQIHQPPSSYFGSISRTEFFGGSQCLRYVFNFVGICSGSFLLLLQFYLSW